METFKIEVEFTNEIATKEAEFFIPWSAKDLSEMENPLSYSPKFFHKKIFPEIDFRSYKVNAKIISETEQKPADKPAEKKRGFFKW